MWILFPAFPAAGLSVRSEAQEMGVGAVTQRLARASGVLSLGAHVGRF